VPDELVHYIAANGTVAIFTKVDDSNPATDRLRYLHRDHLGSVALVTDEAGLVAEARSFDPWGRARNADWTPSGSDIPLTETKRGFTGHEHLDTVGLIHMNGRVYDPVIGRFVSADPTVQAPDLTQTHNRYTYVLNNPLSLTDPSGFGWLKKFWKKIRKVIHDVLPAVLQIAATTLACGFPPGIGCAIGFAAGFAGAQTMIAGGNFGDALLAAAQAAAFAALTYKVGDAYFQKYGNNLSNFAKVTKTLAHGVVGGVQSVVRGGSFRSGFLAGGFAAAVSASGIVGRFETAAGRITAAAVAGGVGSVLGGGKFANGAVTGAFQRLFNDEMDHGNKRDMRITKEQRELAAAREVRKFWESRLEMGDPVAPHALASLDPPGGVIDYLFGGESINNRIQAFARVYLGHELNLDEVRVDLMNAHIEAVDADQSGTWGLLNPQQIAIYHHKVFGGYNLPSTAFGGTPHFGIVAEADWTRPFWCGECDY